jgi:hypothetical protein
MGINQYSVWEICQKKHIESWDIHRWCVENLGEQMDGAIPVWEGKYSANRMFSTIFIYDDQKAMMFALRWL